MAPRPRRQYYRPQPRGPRKNEQIHAPQVRLLDEAGDNLGIVAIEKALQAARDKELDLIEISEKADPPVARIMDYGKYLYEQGKKSRDAEKKQRSVSVTKGVRISLRTSEHDAGIKAGRVDKFLKKGYKVRVEVFLRGREKGLRDMIDNKIKEFLSGLAEEYVMEQEPTRYPRGIYFTLRKG